MKVTPRFKELNPQIGEQVNKFINSVASFRDTPFLSEVLTKATHEFQREMFQHVADLCLECGDAWPEDDEERCSACILEAIEHSAEIYELESGGCHEPSTNE